MRLALRLAQETKENIEALKQVLIESDDYAGLNLTNGFVVNQAYKDTQLLTEQDRWHEVIKKGNISNNKPLKEKHTDLNVTKNTIDGINELKTVLHKYFPESAYLTTSFAIRIMVRGALLLRNQEI